MLVTIGWLLLASLSPRTALVPPTPAVQAEPRVGRVAVWSDREDPYRRGEPARVYLSVDQPAYVAVFRVDTDGRLGVLFPRDPWDDGRVRDGRELEVSGSAGARAFIVDDDPGVGYLFAVASRVPLDFREVTRGDRWDFRLVEHGRIQRDPYVALTDLAARLSPDAEYDYDITPYYVDQRYDYPRFVCYDCHTYASYGEWNPYRTACTRYRVVVRDDARYYPYRYGGRNVVADRPSHPGPRYVFRDADPTRAYVSRGEPVRRRSPEDDRGRTSEDVGGRGAVPAPTRPGPAPARPFIDERRAREPDGERQDSAHDTPRGLRPVTVPQSTGEPELRRRRP